MWNLKLNFDIYQAELWKLLEFESEYALRMSQLEHTTLGQAMLTYTEWSYMAGYFHSPRAEQLAWMETLKGADDRRAFFESKVIPEQQRIYDGQMAHLRESFGGFSFEVCGEYYSNSPEQLLTIHFRNFFAPDSPFDHRHELAENLQRLVTTFHDEHPDIVRIQCASWLNNLPVFLSLFPREWGRGRTLCLPFEASTGWWGALIDHNGFFSEDRAWEFRRRGGFALPNMHCRCTIASLLEHLKTLV